MGNIVDDAEHVLKTQGAIGKAVGEELIEYAKEGYKFGMLEGRVYSWYELLRDLEKRVTDLENSSSR